LVNLSGDLTVVEINEVITKVSIEIPTDQVDAEIEKAYAEIRKKASIDGFRDGKAPMQLVKSTCSDMMQEEVMQHFFNKTFYKALDDHKISPISIPTFTWDVLEQGTPFKYSAMFEVMPEIHVKDYTGLTVRTEKFLPNPEIIEEEIRRMQLNMAQCIPVDADTVVGNDHTVFFDYSFSVEGNPDMDASAKGAMLELGTGADRMLPGFEKQLIGMKCGESKEIRVPQHAAAEGREGVFRVTVTKIERKELPELNDELAKQCGEYETMEALREKMTEHFQKQELDRIEFDLHERLIKALIERNPLEVPQSMVNALLDHMLENYNYRLKSEGSTREMTELDDQNFRFRFRDSAEVKVKGDLLLTALVEKENLVVTEEDLVQRYKLIAADNSGNPEQIREFYESNSEALNLLLEDIKVGKAIRFLQDRAVITEVEPAELHASCEESASME
jgi:trigger factor